MLSQLDNISYVVVHTLTQILNVPVKHIAFVITFAAGIHLASKASRTLLISLCLTYAFEIW